MINTKPTKTSKGKAKIPIQLITNKNSLYVSFSKRKHGLFKKSALLCSDFPTEVVETALIVFSPTGKPYSFGHPNPDSVIERFLGQNGIGDEEKNKKEENNKKEEKGSGNLYWWDDLNVDELSLEQLVELESTLEEVKNMAIQKAVNNYASLGSTLFDLIN